MAESDLQLPNSTLTGDALLFWIQGATAFARWFGVRELKSGQRASNRALKWWMDKIREIWAKVGLNKPAKAVAQVKQERGDHQLLGECRLNIYSRRRRRSFEQSVGRSASSEANHQCYLHKPAFGIWHSTSNKPPTTARFARTNRSLESTHSRQLSLGLILETLERHHCAACTKRLVWLAAA